MYSSRINVQKSFLDQFFSNVFFLKQTSQLCFQSDQILETLNRRIFQNYALFGMIKI